MSLPPLPDQLYHIAQAFLMIVTGGFLFCAIVMIAQAWVYGAVKRPETGELPGIVELDRPGYLGAIPEFYGSVGAILGALALYAVLSTIVIVGSAVSILVTGSGIPVEQYLYFIVAFSVIYTLVLQDEIRQQVASSKWYLGYDSL